MKRYARSLLAHLSSCRHLPDSFHLLTSDAVDFIVEVYGAANVVGDDIEALANAVFSIGSGDIYVTVLFREAFDFGGVIFFDQAEAALVFSLIAIGGECFRTAVDYRVTGDARADDSHQH